MGEGLIGGEEKEDILTEKVAVEGEGEKEVKQRESQTGERGSFVVPGSMGGSAQSFIKGKCCQDAGRLKAPRPRCDLCSRHEAINHPGLCFHRLLLLLPLLRLERAQTLKCAHAINTCS